jgi:hypothetical protein
MGDHTYLDEIYGEIANKWRVDRACVAEVFRKEELLQRGIAQGSILNLGDSTRQSKVYVVNNRRIPFLQEAIEGYFMNKLGIDAKIYRKLEDLPYGCIDEYIASVLEPSSGSLNITLVPQRREALDEGIETEIQYAFGNLFQEALEKLRLSRLNPHFQYCCDYPEMLIMYTGSEQLGKEEEEEKIVTKMLKAFASHLGKYTKSQEEIAALQEELGGNEETLPEGFDPFAVD